MGFCGANFDINGVIKNTLAPKRFCDIETDDWPKSSATCVVNYRCVADHHILTMSVISAYLADNYHHILTMSVIGAYLADNYHHILTMSVIRAYLADSYHHILTMSVIGAN